MMKKEKAFKETGNWYKGNLHSHTTNSDGKLNPHQSTLIYKQHGYSFMCLSEHDYYTDIRKEIDTKDFILLPGLEASVYLVDVSNADVNSLTNAKGYIDVYRNEIQKLISENPDFKLIKTHHIHGILGNKNMRKEAGDLCFNKSEFTPVRIYFDKWNAVKAAQDLSDYLKSRGCFTTYNHPIWSRVDLQDVDSVQGIWAIEIFNYATVNECAEGYDTYFWDSMLRKGNEIMAFASDDNHNGGVYSESFGGYVMVNAKELSHENIVNSLLEGNYYSSTGAQIKQWGIKENRVYIECLNAKRVNFICGGYVGASKTIMQEEGQILTYVEHELQGNETYVRIDIIDEKGKRAWTNPMILK